MEPGGSTAVGSIVTYRLGKLAERGLLSGRWLDCGCADGGYAAALLGLGVSHVSGIDPQPERIEAARQRGDRRLEFVAGDATALPWPDGSFDGVLLNEVLEHVSDERAVLAEVHRVLRPGGHLALFSPNRFFPFEGHGFRLTARRNLPWPVPLVPWLPERLTYRHMHARNYWPWQIARLLRETGFRIVHSSTAFPQFEIYPWLPARAVPMWRRLVGVLERIPGVRWFGVSCFLIARTREAHG